MTSVMLFRHTPGAILFAVLAVYALGFASSYDQRILTLAGVYTILVLGYQFVFGHAGALSLAQGAFFGAGAYITGIASTRWDAGFVLTFPLSIAGAALLAAMVAAPVLRLRTHYFALATLAFAQLLLLIAVNWETVTGGANGIPGVPPAGLFGWEARRGLPLLVLVWSVAGAGMLVVARQMDAPRRAAYSVARETPLAAPAFGIDASALRLRAFLLSAAFGGAAGALFAHTNRVVSPETLGFGVMVSCLAMTVVGGRYRIVGAVIGALLLTHLPEWLRGLDEYYLVAMGALLLVMVVFAPDGLASFLPGRPAATDPLPSADTPPCHAFVRNTGALEATGLSKRYGGVQALDRVDLTVGPGEVVGIIGPNGAGKTTLANVITGLAAADAGTVRLGGKDITAQPPHAIARAGLARTFQTPQLPAALSVATIVDTARRHAEAGGRNGPGPAVSPEVSDALSFCGLGGHADISAGVLAHGLRRRTDICRALVTCPGVVILDEPAAGLSADEQAEIGDLCASLAGAGMAVVLIDHNVDFLRPVATRLVCMEAGRIIADGPPDDTLSAPAVRAAYFGMGV